MLENMVCNGLELLSYYGRIQLDQNQSKVINDFYFIHFPVLSLHSRDCHRSMQYILKDIVMEFNAPPPTHSDMTMKANVTKIISVSIRPTNE